MTKKEFKKWLINQLTYDGSGLERCPHCQKIVDYGYRYLDKVDSLSSKILRKLGFNNTVRQNMHPLLFRLLNDVPIDVQGSRRKDANVIIDMLIENFPVKFEN